MMAGFGIKVVSTGVRYRNAVKTSWANVKTEVDATNQSRDAFVLKVGEETRAIAIKTSAKTTKKAVYAIRNV